MNCTNCGNEIKSGDAFCGSCGQPVKNIENTNTADMNSTQNKIPTTPPIAKKETVPKTVSIKKDTLKKWLPIGIGVAVAVIVAITIIATIASRVSLKNYISDEYYFTGINGYGSIEFEDVIDYEALDAELKGEYTGSDKGDIWGYSDEYAEYMFASSSDYIEVIYPENNGALSNGDEVELTIAVDTKGIKNNKAFKKTISGGETHTFKYTVEGLPEGTVIDVFDAVESFTLDTTSNNSTDIALKADYVKDYGNGISVHVEDGYSIKVYGDDFHSFSVGVEPATDNIHADTQTVKLVVDCEPDEFAEKGIIISPAEKEINVTVLSWITDGVFNESDLKALKAGVDKVVSEQFDTKKFKFSEANFYYYEGGWSGVSTMFCFCYTDGEKTYVLRVEDLKKDDNGNVYELDYQEVRYHTSLFGGGIFAFDSVEAFEKEIVFQNKYQITIPE